MAVADRPSIPVLADDEAEALLVERLTALSARVARLRDVAQQDYDELPAGESVPARDMLALAVLDAGAELLEAALAGELK